MVKLNDNLKYESTENLLAYAKESDNEVMKELAERLEAHTMPRTNVNRERGKFMARTLSEFVNAYNYDKLGFAEALMSDHNTIQQSAISLMLFTIRAFSQMNPAQVDPRNRRAVQVCQKITDFMEENNLPFTLPLI